MTGECCSSRPSPGGALGCALLRAFVPLLFQGMSRETKQFQQFPGDLSGFPFSRQNASFFSFFFFFPKTLEHCRLYFAEISILNWNWFKSMNFAELEEVIMHK